VDPTNILDLNMPCVDTLSIRSDPGVHPRSARPIRRAKDDVVIFVLTSKGPQNFTIVPPTFVNRPQPADGPALRVIETASCPGEVVIPEFPERSAQTLHREPDDLFR